MQKLSINTSQKKQVIDLTRILNDFLMKNAFNEGVVFLFLTHTTCALTTADLDPGTDLDYLAAFEALIPKLEYKHQHDPSHVGDHILSATIGTSLTLQVQSASLVLGQWQRVVLLEFDGPRERRLSLTFLPMTSSPL